MNKEGLAIDFRYFYFIRFLLFLFGKKIQHLNQLSENKENRHVSYKTHSNCAIDRSCGFCHFIYDYFIWSPDRKKFPCINFTRLMANTYKLLRLASHLFWR